jgi:DNA polymerase III subunit epsilon
VITSGQTFQFGRVIIETDHRSAAYDWARQIVQEPRVVFLDTETTGLNNDAEVIDIAIVDRDGHVLLDTLVRPSDVIPLDATNIHGLDDPAVADAPTWDAVYPLVGRILDSYGPVVVYNADFDRRVISQTNALYGLPDFDADWQCAMKQHAAYVGIWHDKYSTWRWHKLVDALQMMGHRAPAVQHRAVADAEGSRQVVFAMAAGIDPVIGQPSNFPAVVRQPERSGESRPQPLHPEIVGPEGEERFGEDPSGWQTRTGTFPGGQFTVISTKTRGCSPGLLAAILIGGTIVIGVGCCAFFYLFAQLIWA